MPCKPEYTGIALFALPIGNYENNFLRNRMIRLVLKKDDAAVNIKRINEQNKFRVYQSPNEPYRRGRQS
jgi:hypothetical protein